MLISTGMQGAKGCVRRWFGRAAATTVVCALSILTSGAAPTPQGLVLTGGTLVLDFADPANGHPPNTLDRLDSLTWSGGSGALAGQNLVFVGPAQSVDECLEPISSFGQNSYLYPGELAAFANRTALTTTSITTGGSCSFFSPPNLAYSQITLYNVFPAGDPNVNEFRLARTFPSFNPSDFSSNRLGQPFSPQYWGYVPAVSSALLNTVLYPNTAGTITTVPSTSCTTVNSSYTGGCEETDWKGTWFADDNGSGSGIVIFRDASSITPAVLNVFFPEPINIFFDNGNANQNLTMIALRPVADAQGVVASFTETEWVCVYDPTTWPAAARTAGTLPTGCAQRAPTAVVGPNYSFTPAVNVTPGTVITSNVVHLTGLGTSSISITGGSYSLNGGAYTTASQGFSGEGDLTVQVMSASGEDIGTQYGLASATVTINNVSSEFLVVSDLADPTITVQVNPATITLGQSATLTWNTNYVDACMAGGAWSGAQAASGMTTVTPTTTGTFTYSLECTANPPEPDSVRLDAQHNPASAVRFQAHRTAAKPADTAEPTLTGSATLTVTAAGATPAPTVMLTANPSSLTLGAASTLSWTSTNATACTASGAWSGAKGTSGTSAQTPTAAGTSTYTLTCTGTGGSASASATVTAIAAAAPVPTVTLAANPSSVIAGSASTLTWSSTNATSCTASGSWSGAEATSGTSTQTPATAGADTFTLTCTGAGGSAVASATVTATAPPVPTVTLAASPASISIGDTTTLTWSSANATACTASGAWSGAQAVSGTSAQSPTSAGSFVYTLTCTGAGGSANASANLTVSAPTTVVTTSSGRIGGGGAIDVVSLLGLLSVSWLVQAVRRRPSTWHADASRLLPILVLALPAILTMNSFPARAADGVGLDFGQSYIGLRAGESMYQPSVRSILNSVGPDAADINSLSISKHQFGGVVYAGVPIWHSLSLEIGYAQIGQFPMSMTTITTTGAGSVPDSRARTAAQHAQVRAVAGTAATVDAIAQEVVDAAPPAGHGATVGLALPIDITSRLSVAPRLALLAYKSDQTLRTPDATVHDDFWGTGFDVGGTVTARLLNSLYIGAGVDCFHQTRSCNTVLLEGVIEYRFGR